MRQVEGSRGPLPPFPGMETLPARHRQPSEIPLESEFPRAGLRLWFRQFPLLPLAHLVTAPLVTPDPNTPALGQRHSGQCLEVSLGPIRSWSNGREGAGHNNRTGRSLPGAEGLTHRHLGSALDSRKSALSLAHFSCWNGAENRHSWSRGPCAKVQRRGRSKRVKKQGPGARELERGVP